MRRSALEKIRDSKRKQTKKFEFGQETAYDDIVRMMFGTAEDGTPHDFNPTQRLIHYEQGVEIVNPDTGEVGREINMAYAGPAGCAKTATGCSLILARALFDPGSESGVARWDYNKLLQTTVVEMEKMLHRLPSGLLIARDRTPPMSWTLRPIARSDDDRVSVIRFIGIKDNLGSYGFHNFFIDEADDVDDIKKFEEVKSRIRLRGYPATFLVTFNPPDKSHPLYTACTGLDHKDRKIREPMFKPFYPSRRENERNLKVGYYDGLLKDLSPDMAERLVHGKWGSIFPGKPVYREFKRTWHGRRGLKKLFDPTRQLLRFWDFGYNVPVCIWAQTDWEGRLLILREEVGERIEAQPFASRCKAITATEFSGARNIIDYGDPAARQKKDTGSTLATLAKEGIVLRFIIANIDPGLRTVRKRLELTIGGEPAFQIDMDECPVLVGALSGGYRMDDAGLKPEKDGWYEHPADALRYGLTNLYGVTGERGEVGGGFTVPTSVEYDATQDTGG